MIKDAISYMTYSGKIVTFILTLYSNICYVKMKHINATKYANYKASWWFENKAHDIIFQITTGYLVPFIKKNNSFITTFTKSITKATCFCFSFFSLSLISEQHLALQSERTCFFVFVNFSLDLINNWITTRALALRSEMTRKS